MLVVKFFKVKNILLFLTKYNPLRFYVFSWLNDLPICQYHIIQIIDIPL